MNTHVFIQYLRKFEPVNSALEADLLACISAKTYAKRSMLVRAGEIADTLFLIEKGLGRSFIQVENKEMTTDLFLDGNLMTIFSSFINRSPSKENLELLEESALFALKYSDLQMIYRKHPQMERIGRIIAEKNYESLSSHTHMLKFSTTSERYDYLLAHKPHIIQRAPLGIVASYLGMTLENLSRVRRNHGSTL